MLLMMTAALAMLTYDDDHDKDEAADDDDHHDDGYIVLFLLCSSPPFSRSLSSGLMSFGTCHSCRLPCLVFPWSRRENEVPTKNRKNWINAKFSRVGTFVSYTTRDVLKSSVKIEIR